MAGQPLSPATDRRLGGPIPRQLSNQPRGHLSAINLWHFDHAIKMRHAVLAVVSNCCPPLKGRFLTRYSPVRHCPLNQLSENSVIRFSFDLHVLSTPPAFVLSQDQTLYKMVSKRLSPFKSNHRVIYHDFIYFYFIVAAFGRIDYGLFTHNFVASLVKSSLRWCFLFSRCLIYKVHVPQAEHSLLYQAQFFLSSTFFKSFSDPQAAQLPNFIAVKQLS